MGWVACRASRWEDSTCRVERMAATSAEVAAVAAARAWRAPWLTSTSLEASSCCTPASLDQQESVSSHWPAARSGGLSVNTAGDSLRVGGNWGEAGGG